LVAFRQGEHDRSHPLAPLPVGELLFGIRAGIWLSESGGRIEFNPRVLPAVRDAALQGEIMSHAKNPAVEVPPRTPQPEMPKQ
jgi:hypothetical protein